MAKQALLDQGAARRLAKDGDPRGVLRAIAEYELLTTFGWAALYGPDTLVPASYALRTRLVMAARAQAEEQLAKEAGGESGGSVRERGESGTRSYRAADGSSVTEHVAAGERPQQRQSALDAYAHR